MAAMERVPEGRRGKGERDIPEFWSVMALFQNKFEYSGI
jgi:hypothetical protein